MKRHHQNPAGLLRTGKSKTSLSDWLVGPNKARALTDPDNEMAILYWNDIRHFRGSAENGALKSSSMELLEGSGLKLMPDGDLDLQIR
jgi:hypothetical protein